MIQTKLIFGTDPNKLHQTNAPSTSVEAAYAVNTTRLEDIVYSVIQASGKVGIISDEVRKICKSMYGIEAYSSITARYKSLKDKDLIKYTGEKRRGTSGRHQNVMIALEIRL
jgi:hypothetical protein